MEFSSFRDADEYDNFGIVSYGFELKNASRIREEVLFDNPAELGIVTGLLTTACIFNLKATVLKDDFFKEPLYLEHLRLRAMFRFVLNLVSFCIFSPFIFSSLVLLYAYRCAIVVALKIELRKKFAGLLEGTDAIWAVEDASCKSVINVLATLEATTYPNSTEFLQKLRKLAQRRLVGPDPRLDKLSCLRKKRYGYFYWEKCDGVDITEHVRWLDTTLENPHEESFDKMLSKLCTQPLPREDQGSWEILVSRNHLWQNCDRFRDMEEGLIFPCNNSSPRNNVRIPIVFRAHHTLGDGFALFRLLLATIADSEDVEVTFEDERKGTVPAALPKVNTKRINRDFEKLEFFGSNAAEIIFRNNKDILGASMPFSLIMSPNLKETVAKYVTMKLRKFVSFHEVGEAVYEFAVRKIKQSVKRVSGIVVRKLCQITRVMSVLIGVPSCLVQQAIRSMDNSALHGPRLSGEKFISWWIEGDSEKDIGDRDLLTKIQRVKNATGTRFGDVVLAGLSASLHKYFKQIGEFAPKSLTVVLPSRMSVSDENLRLDNGFSVGLLPLCISGSDDIQNKTKSTEIRKELTMMERLFDVARCSHKLRGESDYLVNFWVMKWLSAILPEVLLRPVLQSHSTLVFSNIPGPREVQILGQRLRNIVFWVPQRGSTGIGFSVLSYAGKMHLGLIADRVLIQNENLLAGILENTVREIDNLHDIIFMSPFSKSLHNLTTASRNSESESCE